MKLRSFCSTFIFLPVILLFCQPSYADIDSFGGSVSEPPAEISQPTEMCPGGVVGDNMCLPDPNSPIGQRLLNQGNDPIEELPPSNGDLNFEGIQVGHSGAQAAITQCVQQNQHRCTAEMSACMSTIQAGCRGYVTDQCIAYLGFETVDNAGCQSLVSSLEVPPEIPIPRPRPPRPPPGDNDTGVDIVDDDSDGDADPEGGGTDAEARADEGGGEGEGGEEARTDEGEGNTDPNNPRGTPDTSSTQLATNLENACIQAYADANRCCNSPLSCMGVDQGTQNDIGSLATIAGSAGAGMMQSGNPQSIQQACDMMRMAGYSATGLNGAGAFMCNENKNGCLDVCENSRAEIRHLVQQQCNYDPARTHGSCPGLQASYDIVNSRQLSCSSFSLNVAAMGQQAAHSGTAAQMAGLCQQLSQTSNPSTTGFEETTQDFTAIDCSDPANQYDPRCRDCSNPTMADTPLCRGNGSGDGNNRNQANNGDGSSVDVSSSANFGSRPENFNTFDTTGDVNAAQQGPQFGEMQNQKSAARGIPNNGGGFTGGTSAAGFGGGGGSGGSRGGSGGYNTDVLRGVSGGSGYSNPAGGGGYQARGGAPNYRGNRAPASRKSANGFDLKQFLPGGSNDPNRRLAGMAGTAMSEIGPSHSDIWQRLSNRVREICKLNRLYNCGR